MDANRWNRAKELFGAALEREPVQRSAFLAEACGGDESLREEIESLLAAHQDAGTTMSGGTGLSQSAGKAAPHREDLVAGRRIGVYQVMRRIGQGGMAAVYLAVRADDQYKKCVAIKLIPPGLDTDELLHRFRNERQTLAALDHPNIIKLLDGGTTEDGLPYLVMDYVEGTAITEYCDSHRLSTTERLELFRKVCEAVSYAHQRLVIHRDLKPGNILVTAEGEPKLLDFGIAKLLNPVALGEMVPTGTGHRLMTPEYASPEQVRGEPLTNATDIYSLGVILYELLTGHRPYQMRGHTVTEIVRAICEEQPAKPSTVVTREQRQTSPYGTTTLIGPEEISRIREGKPDKLRKRLQGDLDTIVLTALRKEPQRRYTSVYEFSEDIRRHLQGLPVKTRPSTIVYRSSKFLLRHKEAALTVVLMLALIGAVLSWEAYQSGQKRPVTAIAVMPFVSEGTAGPQYLNEALAENIIDDLSRLSNLRIISQASTFRYEGKAPDLRQVGRELGVGEIITGRITQQADKLSVTVEMIDTADGAHLWGEQYEAPVSRVFELQENISSHLSRRLQSNSTEARLDYAKRRPANIEAYQLYMMGRYYWNRRTEEKLQKSVEYFQAAIKADPRYAVAYAGLADAHALLAVFGSTPPREAFARCKIAATTALAIDDSLAEAHTSLAWYEYQFAWDWRRAEEEFQRAIKLNPNYATAHHWYADYLTAMGRPEDAVLETKLALEIDPLSLIINRDLGWNYYFGRRYDKAEDQLRRTLDMDHDFVPAHTLLGRVYIQEGKYPEAIVELQRAVSISSNDDNTAMLGYVFAAAGNHREARRILDELKMSRSVSPYLLALIHAALGEKDQAFELLEEAYQSRDGNLVYLRSDPRVDSLRSDPRLAGLTNRIGL